MAQLLHSEDIQRATDFFRRAGLERLFHKLREKYIEIGKVGGQIRLQESTPRERQEIASFLGKPCYRDTTITIKLSDIDHALRQSRFACNLPDLLAAYFPDQPLITRSQQRAVQQSHQEHFRQALQAIVESQSKDSLAQRWLVEGQHGQEWLFARSKNAPTDEQEQQLTIIRSIADLLQQLPDPAHPERLALFAQRTSGDPHRLDAVQPTGRLFLQALSDLFGEYEFQGRVQEIQLYQHAGLLVDTISSNVAVFNLAGATKTDGSADPWIATAEARILLLPLCQLMQWQIITSPTSDIYIIENPQVFEEIVANIANNSSLPTIVCTSGWPSVAALMLLDLLLSSSLTNHLHYSGDFDIKGLQIAASLIERYAGHCHPWHIDAEAYQLALQADGLPASNRELELLNTLPPIFSQLIEQMRTQGKWAYQEGIAQLLVADVKKGF